jgi:hypothetical protein
MTLVPSNQRIRAATVRERFLRFPSLPSAYRPQHVRPLEILSENPVTARECIPFFTWDAPLASSNVGHLGLRQTKNDSSPKKRTLIRARDPSPIGLRSTPDL